MWLTVCVITSFFSLFSFLFHFYTWSPSIPRTLWSKCSLCDPRARTGIKVTTFQHPCCLQHLSDTLINHLSSLPHSNDNNLFLNHHHPNGVIHSAVQDAPLALITKPRSQSSVPASKPLHAATSPPYPMPINLSTSTKDITQRSASKLKSSASSGVGHKPRKSPKSLSKSNSSRPLVDLVRSSESDIHSSKDSDDSLGDDYDDDDGDDIEDEDSGSSLSG